MSGKIHLVVLVTSKSKGHDEGNGSASGGSKLLLVLVRQVTLLDSGHQTEFIRSKN